LNIVLNIQSPGYYADSLNVKGQHYKLNVETPFFTLLVTTTGVTPPHLELNIVLNIQCPGYYADSLNVKEQHYKLNVETPFFTLLVTTAGVTPPHLG
jgi:hypothetical protein